MLSAYVYTQRIEATSRSQPCQESTKKITLMSYCERTLESLEIHLIGQKLKSSIG